jgi:catechol 2,3-dioxygenase-like lactoylglutathione lyase family enzyme
MDRSIRFYADAFGAVQLTRPFVLEGQFAEAMMEGPPGVRFRLCHLRLGTGMIELFQFLEPEPPAEPAHPSRLNVMHIALRVDDVDAAVERLLAAGGRLVFPITAWGGHRLAYAADPDGTIIELADAPLSELLTGTLEQFPEARLDPEGTWHR